VLTLDRLKKRRFASITTLPSSSVKAVYYFSGNPLKKQLGIVTCMKGKLDAVKDRQRLSAV
jgi:hypothetical protein